MVLAVCNGTLCMSVWPSTTLLWSLLWRWPACSSCWCVTCVVCRSLSRNTTVTSLNLRDNALEDAGMTILAQGTYGQALGWCWVVLGGVGWCWVVLGGVEVVWKWKYGS